MITLYDKLIAEIVLDQWPTDPYTCTEWQYGKTSGGYGAVWEGNKQRTVHRVVYCDTRCLDIDVVDRLQVWHRCNNKLCFRPSHLYQRHRTCPPPGGQSGNAENRFCPAGHEYTEKDTGVNPVGGRECRACSSRLLCYILCEPGSCREGCEEGFMRASPARRRAVGS